MYRITLPANIHANYDTVDTSWLTAVFVNENIKPEYIVCIGWYMPLNSDVNEEDERTTAEGYFTGHDREVDNFEEIITANETLSVQVADDQYFYEQHYIDIVLKQLDEDYLFYCNKRPRPTKQEIRYVIRQCAKQHMSIQQCIRTVYKFVEYTPR